LKRRDGIQKNKQKRIELDIFLSFIFQKSVAMK